jgi:hypothetical protein
MELIFRKKGRVRQRLTHIFLFQIREIRHDVRRSHSVGYEIDNVGHRNPETADGRPAGENVRIMADAIQPVCHA